MTPTTEQVKTPKKKRRYKAKKNRPAIDLYLCTVYKGPDYTPEMKFNYEKLQNVDNLNLQFMAVEAGYFSHRHQKGIPDPVQIKWRDEYLKNVPVGSWILVLDSDETIGGAVSRIPDFLHIMEANNIDYAGIVELLPDFDTKVRPRFIYKRRENMSYGGPTQRHDVIWTCSGMHEHEDICPDGYNYIDVSDAARYRSWILGFLYFNHYKNGYAMNVFGMTDKEKLPENVVTLEDIEEDTVTAQDVIDALIKDESALTMEDCK